jgi:predicted acyltransferase (DUF342 family)
VTYELQEKLEEMFNEDTPLIQENFAKVTNNGVKVTQDNIILFTVTGNSRNELSRGCDSIHIRRSKCLPNVKMFQITDKIIFSLVFICQIN